MPEEHRDDAHPVPARRPTTAQALNAIQAAQRALGRDAPTDAASGNLSPYMPTARCREALDLLAYAGSLQVLDDRAPNLKGLCVNLLDWHGGPSRATKSVVKALGVALKTSYPQGVEMASFAAACSPLLEPDRLARLIALAPGTRTAFAPQRHVLSLAGPLRALLSHFPEQRREQLLTTLWTSAHDGRWWDMTAGVALLAHRERPPQQDLSGRTPAELGQMLIEGTLPYNEGSVAAVSALPPSEPVRAFMADLAEKMRKGDHIDPDLALWASHLPWLDPMDRPETPITWLVRTLKQSITPDPESGQVNLDILGKKPKQWAALYPQASAEEFPTAPLLRRLRGKRLPLPEGRPAPGGTAEQAIIDPILSPAELAENRSYMGNCTWTYLDRLKRGSHVLLKLDLDGERYNAALCASGPTWAVGEVNSRFNRGRVPAVITEGLRLLAGTLPPPGADGRPAINPETGHRRLGRTGFGIR
ncbi:hypothetical protein [Bailinhaonella thermotolerans]|uniref:Uncharacterized protein n=1 Tax=Bailinhaonella thermotolerans TaxID=1070861 RepID=A0A3A4ALS9_9ACTN|nr:hypothetical protein [Bailinhaonella thermotolerans]RJL19962.1 hypothetical protein D5H75_39935 [Bailinhaonella thermotolerans]